MTEPLVNTTTIAVGNPQYGMLHQYKEVRGVMHMKCSGEWFPFVDAPCHVAALRALPDPEDLPPCEINDEDLAAMRELLGQPDLTICKQKGRASWQDAVVARRVHTLGDAS